MPNPEHTATEILTPGQELLQAYTDVFQSEDLLGMAIYDRQISQTSRVWEALASRNVPPDEYLIGQLDPEMLTDIGRGLVQTTLVYALRSAEYRQKRHRLDELVDSLTGHILHVTVRHDFQGQGIISQNVSKGPFREFRNEAYLDEVTGIVMSHTESVIGSHSLRLGMEKRPLRRKSSLGYYQARVVSPHPEPFVTIEVL